MSAQHARAALRASCAARALGRSSSRRVPTREIERRIEVQCRGRSSRPRRTSPPPRVPGATARRRDGHRGNRRERLPRAPPHLISALIGAGGSNTDGGDLVVLDRGERDLLLHAHHLLHHRRRLQQRCRTSCSRPSTLVVVTGPIGVIRACLMLPGAQAGRDVVELEVLAAVDSHQAHLVAGRGPRTSSSRASSCSCTSSGRAARCRSRRRSSSARAPCRPCSIGPVIGLILQPRGPS